MTRKVLVVLSDRANYGRLKPVLQAIQVHPALELCTVAGGSLVLPRFGRAVEQIIQDGFEIAEEVYLEIEGSKSVSMAKSIGLGIVEYSSVIARIKPDIVVVVGDRYETLAAVVSAAYMNQTIIHFQGGEVSGSIDESCRHAITKFAHYHVPATLRAKEYLLRMGEHPHTILDVGCPGIDLIRSLESQPTWTKIPEQFGLAGPYLLAAFHPNTTEPSGEGQGVDALLMGLSSAMLPVLFVLPNIDAGAEPIRTKILKFAENSRWLRTAVHVPPEFYFSLLAHAKCAVGNSSSFVRDASALGTPVVITGKRQMFRECANNVIHVPLDIVQIRAAIAKQLEHGAYKKDALYGDGQVAKRVVERFAGLSLYRQKTLSYLNEDIQNRTKSIDIDIHINDRN